MKVRSRSKGLSYALLPYWWGHKGIPGFFLALSVALILFSAAKPHSLDHIRSSTIDLFSPLLTAVNIPIEKAAVYVRTITGIAQLQTENERLKAENMKLREWYRTAQILQTENVKLKTLLNFKQDAPHSFITARIIADTGNAYARSLLVNAGITDGVNKGHTVMGPDGLIGRIVHAGDKAARVLLINDINSSIPVLIEGTEYKAVMAGTNGKVPSIKYLPQEAKLKDGMAVITSGHGQVFPYGLSIGKLTQVEKGKWGVKMNNDVEKLVFVRILDTKTDHRLKTNDLATEK